MSCQCHLPRDHHGRVSVSLSTSSYNWLRSGFVLMHGTLQKRHLMLSNRRHVLRCRKPSDTLTNVAYFSTLRFTIMIERLSYYQTIDKATCMEACFSTFHGTMPSVYK